MTTETITETPTLQRELAVLVRHPNLLTTGSASVHPKSIWLQYTSNDVADWVLANSDENSASDRTHEDGTRYVTGGFDGVYVTTVVKAVS